MNGWEITDLSKALIAAHDGKTKELEGFVQKNLPFAAVDKNYTRLAVIRPYAVNIDKEGFSDVINIVNMKPEGDREIRACICLVELDENATSENTYPLPQKHDFTGVVISEDNPETLILNSSNTQIVTTFTDFGATMFFIDTEEDIERSFELLRAPLIDIQNIKTERIKPDKLTITSPIFGKLKFNEEKWGFTGTLELLRQKVPLIIFYENGDSLSKAMKYGAKCLQDGIIKKALDKAASELCRLKNKEWLDEDEKKVTKKELIQAITPEYVRVYEDGSIQLSLNDGNMFGGHQLLIDLDAMGGYINYQLFG